MRILSSVLIALASLLLTTIARAECGGDINCVAVSIDPGVPPAHGTPLTSAPLVFGPQAVGTVSAARTILIAAVGGATGQATLDAISLGGTDPGEFGLNLGTCTVGAPSLTHGGAACSITVTFNPTSEGAKNASVTVRTILAASSFSRTVPLSGGLVDVASDPIAKSLVRAQIDTAKRFSRAQIGNVRRRLETLRAESSDAMPAPSGSVSPVQAMNGEARGEQTGDDAALARVLARLGAERSLDLGQLSAVGNEGSGAKSSWWIGGDIHFGTRDASSDGASQTFGSEGLTVGYDRWLNDRIALGIGIGMADGDVRIGTEGSEDSASSTSLAGYASYALSPSVFLDGVLGYSRLSYDTRRFDAAANGFAASSRDGTLWFTSLGAGYEWRREELMISPFARLEFTALDLDGARERGGVNNLQFRSESVDTTQLVLGVLAQAPHETSFGWALPRLRLELYKEDEGNADFNVSAAGVAGAPVTAVRASRAPDETLLFGLGTELFYRNGLQLGLEYQGLHSSGEFDSQILALRLTGDLDGKPASWPVPVRLTKDPVRVEAGYMAMENINRALESRDERTDQGFDVTARKAFTVPVSLTTQVVLSGDLSGTNMREHDGLDRVSVAAQGEYQYRPSASFGAPTFGALARVALDEFDSGLRSGPMYKIGLNVHKRITDRISVFSALDHRVRDGKNAVFDTEDAGLRVSFDYSVTENDLVRLGSEFRQGDTVSSTPGSTFFSAIADAQTPDNAYHEEQFIAYRFEADTLLWSLSYNRALGPRDSFDIGWRYVESDPDKAPPGGSSRSYESQQLSAFYLMLF